MFRRACSALAALTLLSALAAVPAAAQGSAPPFDYIAQAPSLSQLNYPETVREVTEVAMADGETLYVEVVRPDPTLHGEGPWPVIMEASPYHGTIADRSGTRMFPDPIDADGNKLGLTGYFAPRGYAVVMVGLRGTGRSTGCLDQLGPKDASDLKEIVEWAAGQSWSNGKVGMTGHSYVGSTPSVAAAQRPAGLATIVPSAGLASMYDHQFQKGVPYNLQYIGPMVAYEGLALERDLPSQAPGIPVAGGGVTGDNFDANGPNPQTGCGLPNSAATAGSGQVTGQYELWHAQRDHGDGAADADIPVFMIHGVNDNAARIPAAEWFFGGRFDREQDKVWIGQWDHGSTNGRCGGEDGGRTLHPTCRFDQFQYALHAWFDKHLKGMDVDTGPAVEAFLNGEQARSVTQVVRPEDVGGQVVTADAWSRPAEHTTLYPNAADGSLGFAPPAEASSASFSSGAEALLVSAAAESLTFTSAPVAEDTVFLGLSDLNLRASVSTSQIVHLVATLYRVDGDGNREAMNFCAIQPQLRFGVHDVAPVVPLAEMDLPMQCFTMAHWVPEGDHLELEIGLGSPHHVAAGADPQITVFTGPDATSYRLPVVPGAMLHDDVTALRAEAPAGEEPPVLDGDAQAPVEETVTVVGSGAGTRVEPVTSASFEFEVLDTGGNARLVAVATPASGVSDLDLYLSRVADDGTTTQVAAAETGATDSETLTFGSPPAGTYRLEVHNWLGVPAEEVDVVITFFNSDDEPGVAP